MTCCASPLKTDAPESPADRHFVGSGAQADRRCAITNDDIKNTNGWVPITTQVVKMIDDLKGLGWTHWELANGVGVWQSSISSWRTGKVMPRAEQFEALQALWNREVNGG